MKEAKKDLSAPANRIMSQSLPTEQDRIEVIDVLRGFTLFGIALVHFTEQFYAGMPPEGHNIAGPAVIDQVVSGIVGIFIQGKFFMIFSFLFWHELLSAAQQNKRVDQFFSSVLVAPDYPVRDRRNSSDSLSGRHSYHLCCTWNRTIGCFWFPDRLLFILALILVLDVPSILFAFGTLFINQAIPLT